MTGLRKGARDSSWDIALEGGIKYKEPVKRRKQMIVNLLMEHKGGGKCVVKWKSRASEMAKQVKVEGPC